MRKLLFVTALVAVTSSLAAYAASSQAPNVAAASFNVVLRSATGQQVELSANGTTLNGVLSSVHSDYLIVTSADRKLISVPFSSVSYISRTPTGRETEIVLR